MPTKYPILRGDYVSIQVAQRKRVVGGERRITTFPPSQQRGYAVETAIPSRMRKYHQDRLGVPIV
jgi:hypothetical protein